MEQICVINIVDSIGVLILRKFFIALLASYKSPHSVGRFDAFLQKAKVSYIQHGRSRPNMYIICAHGNSECTHALYILSI